jgi:tetraprenyl-beta-curcumene synthase
VRTAKGVNAYDTWVCSTNRYGFGKDTAVASLSPKQLGALVAVAARQLGWGLRAVAHEVEKWRRRAETIPDGPIREDALDALARKRPHLDGAALFWALPAQRHTSLLRVLVAYEIILEFLDNMNERAAHIGLENGFQLHLALVDALDPLRMISDYYRYHPWQEDSGFLRALVEVCRASCTEMPGYPTVHRLVVREARRAQVLALNHDPNAFLRDVGLQRWARHQFPEEDPRSWFELTGAATSSLTIHMLLSQAAETATGEADVEACCRVYFPNLSLIATLLDSYVDKTDDASKCQQSYIAHYRNEQVAVRRLCQIIRSSLSQAQRLHRGHRHVVITASMIAMYLSSDNARSSGLRAATTQLAAAGGPLTKLLIPTLRLWRLVYKLRAA